MSSELLLDVRHLDRWRHHLVNAYKVDTGWRKVMAAYRQRDDLKVTCGLTACTPGSAPDPTLGNEYGITLPYLLP